MSHISSSIPAPPIELPFSGVCIHQLFEQQVQRTPDAIAIVTETSAVTYQQLNQKADALAHYLATLGVGPNYLVGICVERSVDMVVGILGILKAGGAYVPIAPDYPAERTTFILQDTQVQVLLCQSHTEDTLRNCLPDQGTTLVALDRELPPTHMPSTGLPTAGDLMYVIYTSGSTGQPKGVMVAHNGICSRLSWLQKEFPLHRQDRLLQTTSLCFDPSVLEIFRPLAVGAQIVLIHPDTLLDTSQFIQTIHHHQVSVLSVVPSLLRVLLEHSDLAQCQTVNRIFCGGEALPTKTQNLLFETFSEGSVQLHNLYGPTETSIMATCWTCSTAESHATIPIGYPVDGVQVHLLDDDLRPVAEGEVGELYIGGIGLAKGYLNRPELTSEQFFIHPLDHSYLYRTKDLGKRLANGAIQFVGRVDQQVKIRGFRIELGEIESRLEQHPAIAQSAVVAFEFKPGQKRLHAYVVAQDDIPNINALRSWLQTQLPDYMVPAMFFVLDELPLNVNGKLDRNALPQPEDLMVQGTETAVVPVSHQDNDSGEQGANGQTVPGADILETLQTCSQDERQQQLLNYCRTLVATLLCLPMEQIEVDQNLNHLGLDSLLAMQLKNQVQNSLKVTIPISSFITGLSINSLVIQISEHLANPRWAKRPISEFTAKPAPVKQVLDDLEHMADEDLDDLLKTLLPS